MEEFKIRRNHVYIGNVDKAIEWSGAKIEDENSEVTEKEKQKLVAQVRERIKNYLQLDHVSFCLERAHQYTLVQLAYRIFQFRLKRI